MSLPTITIGIIESIAVNLAASGIVVPAIANKSIYVYTIKLNVSASGITIKLQDGANDLEGAQSYAVNAGYIQTVNPPNFIFKTSLGNALNLNIVGAGTIAGMIGYWYA